MKSVPIGTLFLLIFLSLSATTVLAQTTSETQTLGDAIQRIEKSVEGIALLSERLTTAPDSGDSKVGDPGGCPACR